MKPTSTMPAVASPLSAAPPKKIRDLPRAFLLEQLEKYYGQRPPAEAVETDYALWQCAETGLEFAWPMRPGNVCFYKWVSQFDSYYPGVRWEYEEVRRQIAPASAVGAAPRVLDVGCGKGDFLRGLEGIDAGQKFALDLNEPAVQACRAQGFHAFCGTLETATTAGFVQPRQFPVVTSFHCLEHVDQPVEFARSLAGLTAPGGHLFLSTPCSPMSMEADWFDVLNHPPHHLTRWNPKAYRRLAEILGVKLRYHAPPSSAWRRAWNVFQLLQYGPNRRVSKARLLADALRRFPFLIRAYGRQRQRARTNDGISADVILVELILA